MHTIDLFSLIPIWKLAETKERKKELKEAMDQYFKNHKIGFNVDDGPVFEGRRLTGRLQYNDDGSNAKKAFAVYKPDLSDGWYWLGQRGFGPFYPKKDQTFDVIAIRPKSWAKGALSPIVFY